MNPEDIQRGEKMQAEEIALGVKWLRGVEAERFKKFFDKVNDLDWERISRLTPSEVSILRNFALIGIYEVGKAAFPDKT